MMASLLLSRVLGLLREAVISGKLGQGAQSDVYMAAFLLPDTLFFLIAGGALSSAFIPVFTELITHGEESRANALFSTVATLMFVIVSAFILAGMAFTEPLVRLLAYGFGPELIRQVVPLTRIVLPAQLCFFLGGLMMGVQQARGKFLLPGMGPNIYNLGIIAGGLILAHRIGPAGFCWGALVGAVIGNFLLQAWGARKQGLRYRPTLNWRNPDAARVWKLMLPVILGLALPQVSILLNRVFASTLGEGPMSALTRANTLMQAPLAIFGQSLSIAVFPTLSAQAALADWGRMRETIGLGLRFVGFLTIPATGLLIVLGKPITAVLLQHGRFTAADTSLTAMALAYYAIGLSAWSAQALLARSFYAMQDTKTPVIIGTAVTALFVPMNFLFMHQLGLGLAGLALATSIAAGLNAVAMALVLRRRTGGLGLRSLGSTWLRMAVSATGASLVSMLAANAIATAFPAGAYPGSVKLSGIAVLAVAGGLGCVVYLGLARLLGVAELSELIGMLRRRRRSREATG
ncbi:MAG: murein biosynthesis integral membrane protein MurJ [Chthonomonadales bacterium]|nr:murein biosynthesis integral membrane protein MurJ [Chthonomonadales bacterium]